jgi:hypothetical protein
VRRAPTARRWPRTPRRQRSAARPRHTPLVGILLAILVATVAVRAEAVQVAKPDADLDNTGVYVPNTGTTLWETLDEDSPPDDDTTKSVSGTTNPSETDGAGFTISFAAVTDPENNTGHVIYLRGARDSGARDETCHYRLYQGITPIMAAAKDFACQAWTTDVTALSTTEADAITDYSDLNLHVWCTTSGGGAGTKCAYTWVAFQVDDAPAGDTPTDTPSATVTATPTSTGTITDTPTDTPTATPSDTPTSTATDTATATVTDTPTQTATGTETATATATSTVGNTATPTITPTATPIFTACHSGGCDCGSTQDCRAPNGAGQCAQACPDATTTPVFVDNACCGGTCSDGIGRLCGDHVPIYSYVNDYDITITSSAEAAAKRAELISFIWGVDGFPSTAMPSSVDLDVASPVDGLTHLARVDNLTFLTEGNVGHAHHFIPTSPNNKLVIVHNGHWCTFNDSQSESDVGNGFWRTIETLLNAGYSVLAVYLPDMSIYSCGLWVTHPYEMARIQPSTGSSIKIFFQPIAAALNYLKTEYTADSFPNYTEYDMVGLSGGGWETATYPALDTTIKKSVSVAGSWPLYMRVQASPQVLHYKGVAFINDDLEQSLYGFYSIAGYLDLYILDSLGTGRSFTQVFNQHDSCCFGVDLYDALHGAGAFAADVTNGYVPRIQTALTTIGGDSSFSMEIDSDAPSHMISWNTVNNIIMPAINGP